MESERFIASGAVILGHVSSAGAVIDGLKVSIRSVCLLSSVALHCISGYLQGVNIRGFELIGEESTRSRPWLRR